MKDKQESRYKALITIGAVLGAITGILASLEKIFSLGIWNKLFELIEKKPGWLWIRVCLIYISIVAASSALAWLWNLGLLSKLRRSYYEEHYLFFLKLICSLTIQILFVFGLLLVFSQVGFRSQEAKILFPQAVRLGPTLIRTYAANGEVHYSFHEETPLYGPEGYAKITFKTYGRTVEQNCGWVLFLLRGVHIGNYGQLRFIIRGERGNEKVGIKAKDARGIEISLMLDEHYLREGKITTDWQQAIVPFEDFGNVDFSLMDNFSIFSNGLMAGTRPQTIYVGEFQLR